MTKRIRRSWDWLVQHRVAIGLVALALTYLVLQVLFLGRRVFGTDEFRHLERLKAITSALPHAEVSVVKTLVGLYAQAPLYFVVNDSYLVVCALKLQIAAAVAATSLWVGLRLDRWIGGVAALAGVALFLIMPEVLERSSEIRVDMLSALAGAISLVLLCSERWRAAGLWLGVALLCTQKAVYFAVGTGTSLAVLVGLSWRSDRRAALGAVAAVLGWSSLVVLGYAALFATIADPSTVWNDLVIRALEYGRMSGERAGIYGNLDRFWWTSIRGHWGLYGMAATGQAVCVWRARRSRPHLILGSFTPLFFLMCFRHSEPWHYFMVVPAPVLALLAAVAVGEIATLAREHSSLGIALTFGLICYMLVVPGRAIPRNLAYTNEYQRYNIELAASLLGPGDTYLDGVGMITKRSHVPIPELIWLDRMYLRRLERIGEKRQIEILTSLEASPPLLTILNYRTRNLPSWLHEHLLHNYVQVSGSIAIYAPTMEAGSRSLPRSGYYRIEATQPVLINDEWMPPDTVVQLPAGSVRISGTESFRLVTHRPVPLDSRFKDDKEIFTNYVRSPAPDG